MVLVELEDQVYFELGGELGEVGAKNVPVLRELGSFLHIKFHRFIEGEGEGWGGVGEIQE